MWKHLFLQASQGANCTPGTEINLGVEYLTFKEERFKAAALVSLPRICSLRWSFLANIPVRPYKVLLRLK